MNYERNGSTINAFKGIYIQVTQHRTGVSFSSQIAEGQA